MIVSTSRGLHMPDSLVSTPPTPLAGAWCCLEAKGRGHAGGVPCRSRRTRNGARDAGRAGSLAEYELICMFAAAALACSVLASLALALHASMQPSLLGHGMGVVRPRTRSRGDPSACHARLMCSLLSSCVLCSALPAVDLLDALCRCV